MDKIQEIKESARINMHFILALMGTYLIVYFGIFEVHKKVEIIIFVLLSLSVYFYVQKITKAFLYSFSSVPSNIKKILVKIAIVKAVFELLLIVSLSVYVFVNSKYGTIILISFCVLIAIYILMSTISFAVMRKVNVVIICKNEDKVIIDVILFPACNLLYEDNGRKALIIPQVMSLSAIEVDLQVVEIVVSDNVNTEYKYLEHFDFDIERDKMSYDEFREEEKRKYEI